LAECRRLGGCQTGDAKITKGYLLPARHVIHAVGPIWYGGNRGEEAQLASCYRRAIELCHDNNLESVAFPAISTGAFRFPAHRAAKIAVTTTVKALPSAPSLIRVIFCCYSRDSGQLHEEVAEAFGSPCAD
jgi:O-acetyl-ADP-ribose deacetylase (regulator of RNase III)